MAESDLYRKGIALRSELMGEAFAASMNSTTYSDPDHAEIPRPSPPRPFSAPCGPARGWT